MTELATVLSGAVAMASVTAGTFFLRFWRDTSDVFFLFFGVAFCVDAVARLILALDVAEHFEPMCLLARLFTYSLIIVAIVQKNRPASRRDP